MSRAQVSNNNITIDGINTLTAALETRRDLFDLEDNFRFDSGGNFWMEELVNRCAHHTPGHSLHSACLAPIRYGVACPHASLILQDPQFSFLHDRMPWLPQTCH